jgi:hypothetical protein
LPGAQPAVAIDAEALPLPGVIGQVHLNIGARPALAEGHQHGIALAARAARRWRSPARNR